MPPKRKFSKPKWKRGLCQQRGCGLRVKDRSPLCEKHLAARKGIELLPDAPPKP